MDAKTNQIIIDTILPYKPREIAVFGSYARGEMREDSDIDIMVDFDQNQKISLFDLGGMYMDLKELLQKQVDLVQKRGLKEWMKPNILKDAKVIYER